MQRIIYLLISSRQGAQLSIFPFTALQEQDRSTGKNIAKRHFKFTYDSPVRKGPLYILLLGVPLLIMVLNIVIFFMRHDSLSEKEEKAFAILMGDKVPPRKKFIRL